MDDRRIEIRNARLSDSGSYVCVVQNEAGEARKTYELTVLGIIKFNSQFCFKFFFFLRCTICTTRTKLLEHLIY